MEQSKLKGCVINRSWFEQAQLLLKDGADRCQFYEALMMEAFGLPVTKPTNQAAFVMYSMCREYVLSDAEKYAAKCAKNAENARKRTDNAPTQANASERKRTQANASEATEAKPMAANTNTNTNNNTNTNTNLSLGDNERERELFSLIGIFFAKDCKDFRGEFAKWMSYYASTGWRNKNGVQITNKAAAARMWKTTGEPCSHPEQRAIWYEAFKTSQVYDCAIWDDFRGISATEDGRCLVAIDKRATAEMIDAGCMSQLRTLVKLAKCSTIEYRIMPS